jgi:hypothetical protein
MSIRTRLTRWFSLCNVALKLRDAITGRAFSADELASDPDSPVKTALDGKAASSHTHPSSEISDAFVGGAGTFTAGAMTKTDSNGGLGATRLIAYVFDYGADEPLLRLGCESTGTLFEINTQSVTINPGIASLIRGALGIPTYANLTAANSALNAGDIYFDLALGVLRAATV